MQAKDHPFLERKMIFQNQTSMIIWGVLGGGF